MQFECGQSVSSIIAQFRFAHISSRQSCYHMMSRTDVLKMRAAQHIDK